MQIVNAAFEKKACILMRVVHSYVQYTEIARHFYLQKVAVWAATAAMLLI